ncbi:ABC transporter ATP-binding protein [Oceanithermus desulfurans]
MTKHGVSGLRASTRTVLRAVALLGRADPLRVTVLATLLLLEGLLPVGLIQINKLLVDDLAAARYAALGLLVLAWVAAQLLGALLAPVVQALQGDLAERFAALVHEQILAKSASLLGLDVVEDEAFHDDLEVLQSGASSRPLNLIVNLVYSVRDAVTLGALALLLAGYAPWMPLLLLAAAFPYARAMIALREASWRAVLGRSREARAMNYLAGVALKPEHAQEVRLYGLFGWLRGRYREHFTRVHRLMRRTRWAEVARLLLPALFFFGAAGLAFGWTVRGAAASAYSLGTVVLVLQSIARMQRTSQDLTTWVGFLYERAQFFDRFFHFLEASSAVQAPPAPAPLPEDLTIAFENVHFAYPDGRPVLEGVSFRIPAGQTVALVGENGAGKTTVVKLLLRFYDPDEGRITVGGRDLRELDPVAWRRAVGAVLQNFGRYAFTLGENIGLGDLERMGDAAAIAHVAVSAGVDELAARLPHGYDERLGKAFGGTELSGGEWQKVAIARALLRDARLLVLDEPAAALDARAEHALYQSFARLSAGRTVLMISHRLASVKDADRILVLKQGRLVEEGTHAQLLERGGEYHELWTLQARRYASG